METQCWQTLCLMETEQEFLYVRYCGWQWVIGINRSNPNLFNSSNQYCFECIDFCFAVSMIQCIFLFYYYFLSVNYGYYLLLYLQPAFHAQMLQIIKRFQTQWLNCPSAKYLKLQILVQQNAALHHLEIIWPWIVWICVWMQLILLESAHFLLRHSTFSTSHLLQCVPLP